MTIIPTIDELDALIVAELQDDGRRSYKEIGERLGVSAGTVRARALQLMEDGVVDVIAIPNAWKMGFPIVAVVGLRVTPGKAEAVADILAEREEIAWVGLVATGFDVMFEVALKDAQELGHYRERVIASLPGVASSEVFMLWNVRKLRFRLKADRKANGAAPKKVSGKKTRRLRKARAK